MDDNITLDKETFKALAIDTRVNILKKLDERFQLTLTDLATEFGMAPSTISEHLDKLASAGLVIQVDKGMKWKYYRLTPKGKKILNPYEKRVWIILTVSALALFAAVYRLMSTMTQLFSPPQQMLLRNAAPTAVPGPVSDDAAGGLLYAAEKAVETTTTTLVQESSSLVSQAPYAELMLVLLLVLAVGVCVGYLIRRKWIL
jgi:DNA-binding transcriptional ArsR family regulator